MIPPFLILNLKFVARLVRSWGTLTDIYWFCVRLLHKCEWNKYRMVHFSPLAWSYRSTDKWLHTNPELILKNYLKFKLISFFFKWCSCSFEIECALERYTPLRGMPLSEQCWRATEPAAAPLQRALAARRDSSGRSAVKLQVTSEVQLTAASKMDFTRIRAEAEAL